MFDPGLHWVQGIPPWRLALSARPQGGDGLEQDLADWKAASVGAVVSLLEPHEMDSLGLQAEPALCRKFGMDFLNHPIQDHGVPASEAGLFDFVSALHGRVVQGEAVVIHCRAGIGRTGLVAACLLHLLGLRRRDIFRQLALSRGITMPSTWAQFDWVDRFCDRHHVPERPPQRG